MQRGTLRGCGHTQFSRRIGCIFLKKLEVESFGKSAEVYLARRTGTTGYGDVTEQTSQGSWDKREGKGEACGALS